ncbi:MAG: 50S ribosomal protein L21 [Planctomycetota bacterium]|jgi:large subunit ribosomal protein L21
MQAVIETGNRQYTVSEGDVIDVELLGADTGADVTFDQVKLIDNEGAVTVGTPNVDGASVSATILDEIKADKVVGISFRRRKGSQVKTGHRQRYNRVKITGIKN